MNTKHSTFNVELRPIESIRPYPGNPRVNDNAVDAVANSLKEFGFRQPIVVDGDGVIVVGHTRYKAALKLGLKQVPVHVASDMTPAQAKAYRIADNQTATLATWDFELLPIELKDLELDGYDLSLLGFDDDELAHLLETDLADGLTDPDFVPEPPDDPITMRGDIWVLGNHRLMCGDSGSVEDVDRLLDGNVIDLVSMDPPYNVKVEPRSHTAVAVGPRSFTGKNVQLHHHSLDRALGSSDPRRARKKMRPKDRPLAGDFITDEEYEKTLLAWFTNASRVLKPGGSFYIWGGNQYLAQYQILLAASGLYFSQLIVWDKQHPLLVRKDFLCAFEVCFYGWKEGAGHKYYGPHNATNLWHVKKVNPQSMIHLTEKPVELAALPIQYSSLPGQNVLDLFGGSGSTLIAAEQTGRRAFLMEIDALYCDVIVQRWEKFTGRKGQRIPGEAIRTETTSTTPSTTPSTESVAAPSSTEYTEESA